METPQNKENEQIAVEIYIDTGKVQKGMDIIPEALKKLPQEPERLDIKPGICLVVGYNGSGKTTFVTGLYYSVTGARHGTDQDVMEKLPALYFSRAVELGGTFENVLQFDAAISKRGANHMGPHETMSNRQARDYEVKKVLAELKSLENRKPCLIIIDEPEAGMDPWRHQKLGGELEEILKAAPDGSTLLVATNSPVLIFDSNFPRIDLREPEKGVQEKV